MSTMLDVLVSISVITLAAAAMLAVLARFGSPGEWPHEGEQCRCKHGYYDHDHTTHQHPCMALNCPCQTWNPKEK